jgi:DNA-binding NtrC family response regulator
MMSMTPEPDRLPVAAADLIGVSPAAAALRREIAAAAGDDRPAIVVGEPGSGVSLAARLIHACGRRGWRPFVCLDASLHSAESLASELFEAPTDVARRTRLQQAGGGTLCLENVDSPPSKIRRTLAGLFGDSAGSSASTRPGTGDVRLLATTHLPSRACEELRIALTVAVPPLRERREDIGLLTEHFLSRVALQDGRPARQLTVEALRRLERYDWPGNIRELAGVIEQACALDGGPRLTGELIAPWLGMETAVIGGAEGGLLLKDMERKLIETTFARCRGNRERTAQALGIGIRTLSGKLREYGYPPRGGPGSNRPSGPQSAA